MSKKAISRSQMTLNRGQIEKLSKLVNHFTEVEWFTLEEGHESGIGPSVVVKFNLFEEKNDTTVDITDVSTW